MKVLFWSRLCWLFGLLAVSMPLLAEAIIPPLQSRVTDLARVLDAAARQALETKLAEFEQAKGSQIAVLIVPSTQPEAIEQYSIRVVEAWKLGRKGVDDGVLMLFAMQDRAMRIEVGRGLEGVIPDAIAKRVIAEVITPHFTRGDVAGGIDAGADALIRLAAGESLPAPEPSRGGALGDAGPTVLIMAILLGSILRVFFGRLVGAGVAGTLAFVAGWLLVGSLVAAAIAAVLAFLFTLLRGTGGRSTGGLGRGGFGGGLGSSGGFGGGGGGFGGGGASGRW